MKTLMLILALIAAPRAAPKAAPKAPVVKDDPRAAEIKQLQADLPKFQESYDKAVADDANGKDDLLKRLEAAKRRLETLKDQTQKYVPPMTSVAVGSRGAIPNGGSVQVSRIIDDHSALVRVFYDSVRPNNKGGFWRNTIAKTAVVTGIDTKGMKKSEYHYLPGEFQIKSKKRVKVGPTNDSYPVLERVESNDKAEQK